VSDESRWFLSGWIRKCASLRIRTPMHDRVWHRFLLAEDRHQSEKGKAVKG